MSFVKSAIELAKRGFPVFPCIPGEKRALEAGWQQIATTDPLTICELWLQRPRANVGVFTRGYVVIDIDTYKGATFADLQKLGELPRTFTVRSARGGLHVYFRATENFGNSRGDLPSGIDVRGHGGLVLGPGSEFEGKRYEIAIDAPVAELPAWLAERLRKTRPRTVDPTALPKELDTVENVEAARGYLSRAAPAVEGQNGNDRTFAVCAAVRDYSLSFEMALDLLQPWNERCDPPWEDDDLRRILDNATRYRQNAVGSMDPRAGFETIEAPPNEARGGFASTINWYRNTAADDANDPPTKWLASRRLIRGEVTVLAAPGSSGKSLLTLEWAIALALGAKEDGTTFCGLRPLEKTKVLVINAEDRSSMMRMRISAAIEEFELDRQAVWDRIALQSAKDSGSRHLVLAEKTKSGVVNETAHAQELIDFLIANSVGLLVVDPLTRTHRCNENDNSEMTRVMEVYERIARDADCAVLISHHTKKPGAGDMMAGNADAARGASAVINAARIALTFVRMNEKDGERYNIPAPERHRYVRLDDAKMNLALASPHAEWFKLKSHNLPNGEQVGVLKPEDMDAKSAPMHRIVIEALANIVPAGERLSINSAAKKLILHSEFIERSDTWAADAICAALETKEPMANGKSFIWERNGTKRGGTIFVRQNQ